MVVVQLYRGCQFYGGCSVISWMSVLLVEKTGENHQPVTSHWQTLSYNGVHLALTINLSQVTDKLYHIMVYTSPWSILERTTSVMMGIYCIGSCKSNYPTIATMRAPISDGNKKIKDDHSMNIHTNFVWQRTTTDQVSYNMNKVKQNITL